jgi:hypothetical protein
MAAIVGMAIANHKTKHVAKHVVEPQRASQPSVSSTLAVSKSTPPAEIPVAASKPQILPAPVNIQPAAKPQKVPAQAGQPLVINGYAVQDPTARLALNFVGSDPDAEAYWAGAINDPNLPAEERKDLIEDLNEDGLSDPKNPGQEDLPLILNRLQLIEELAPNAMDQVNADAFAEAYKDLVNMLAGQPVQ